MRKLSFSLTAILCASLLSCDRTESPTDATSTGEDLVVIAPRIVRTASISDSLWNATVTVYAGLYDAKDSLIPGTLYSAPFANRRITLPPINANQVVSVYISGANASGNKIWQGWTEWFPAKQFSTGVGVGTDVSIYAYNSPSATPSSDSLVGTWLFIRDYTASEIAYRDVNVLIIKANGTYTINSFTKTPTGTLFFFGYLETGTWSSPQHQLNVTPNSYQECVDGITGCDVSQLGGVTSLYEIGTTPIARRFSWNLAAGKLNMQDLDNSLNYQTWSPYTP